MSKKEIDGMALTRLKACRKKLTWQQYKTLRGQIFTGDPDGAMRGLHTLLVRAANQREGDFYHDEY